MYVAVSRDSVAESHSIFFTRLGGKSVSGYVTLQNAGVVSLTLVNADAFFQPTQAYAIMSGQFTAGDDDVLTSIYFRVSGSVSVLPIGSSTPQSRTFVWEFRINGSRPITAGTYVVVVRVDYSVTSLEVHHP